MSAKETPPAKLYDRAVAWVGERINEVLNPPPLVMELRLSGIIMDSKRSISALSLTQLCEGIDKAFENPRARAVALSLNSPGGSPAQSALIAGYIRDRAEEKEIPVYGFVEDVAASGGYWLACAADEIYALPSSIVGSIGVISSGFGFQNAIDKLGIERRIHTSGTHKSLLDPFQPEKPEDVSFLKDLQKELHQQFIAYVKERRGTKLQGADNELFEGKFWSGDSALKLGLIDGLGDMHSVMKEKFGADIAFKRVEKPKGWLEKRLGLLSSSSGIAGALDGEALLEALESRSYWQRFGL